MLIRRFCLPLYSFPSDRAGRDIVHAQHAMCPISIRRTPTTRLWTSPGRKTPNGILPQPPGSKKLTRQRIPRILRTLPTCGTTGVPATPSERPPRTGVQAGAHRPLASRKEVHPMRALRFQAAVFASYCVFFLVLPPALPPSRSSADRWAARVVSGLPPPPDLLRFRQAQGRADAPSPRRPWH